MTNKKEIEIIKKYLIEEKSSRAKFKLLEEVKYRRKKFGTAKGTITRVIPLENLLDTQSYEVKEEGYNCVSVVSEKRMLIKIQLPLPKIPEVKIVEGNKDPLFTIGVAAMIVLPVIAFISAIPLCLIK